MLKSSLCDYSDAYILGTGRITVNGAGDDAAAREADEKNKGRIFRNCAAFTNCKTEIDNIEIDNAKDTDTVMPMYNLIQYSENYSRTSGSLWKYYKDEQSDKFTNSESFKSEIKIIGNTPGDGNTKDVEAIVPLAFK